MKIDMSNNERMVSAEGLVGVLELKDADLAQVQGARGSNHTDHFHHRSSEYDATYWNDPDYWGYPPNYWWYPQPYSWFFRGDDRWDHRRDDDRWDRR